VLAVAIFATVSTQAFALYDLQITEIWPGNEPGGNLSEDWFELTNMGDMAWSAVVDGDLYYDDESLDPLDAALMSGIASIAPGESVIFVNDGPAGAAEWSDLWDDVVILPQVGHYDGAGLGQGGDVVGIFIDAPGDPGPPTGLVLIEADGYPDAELNGGQSWDTVLGAFSTVGNANGAVATLIVNDEGQPAIGSPGPAVPEPASLLLVLMGAAVATMRYRIG
jgi:hypothetical protein